MVQIIMGALSWIGATIGLTDKIVKYCKNKNKNAGE